MEKYKIDFPAKKIIITQKFEKAMQKPDSDEYALVKQLVADYPFLSVKKQTRRSPASYRDKDVTKTIRHPNKNLTYKHMESFINALPNHEEYMKEYVFIKGIASKLQLQQYALVNQWFVRQFPKFRSAPLFYVSNIVPITDRNKFIQDAIQKKEKEAS